MRVSCTRPATGQRTPEPHWRTFLPRPYSRTTHHRLIVLNALATTRLLFATETWIVPTCRQVKTMDQALHDACDKALGLTGNITSTTVNYLRPLHPGALLLLLRARRLRHILRLTTKAPDDVLKLLFHHSPMTQWEQELRRDLLWLREAMGSKLHELPPTSADDPDPTHLSAWLDFATRYPTPWARFITLAGEQACQHGAQGVPPTPTGVYTLPPSPPAPKGSRPPLAHRGQPYMPAHDPIPSPSLGRPMSIEGPRARSLAPTNAAGSHTTPTPNARLPSTRPPPTHGRLHRTMALRL